MGNTLEERSAEIMAICPLIKLNEIPGKNPFECLYKKGCGYQELSFGQRYCKKTSRNAKSYEE